MAEARTRDMRRLARSVTGETRDYATYLIAIQEEQYLPSPWRHLAGLGLAGLVLVVLAITRRTRIQARVRD